MEGAKNIFEYENDHQWHTPSMGSKMLGIELKKGERLRLQTPGGGGYGDPKRREAALTAQDQAGGYVHAQLKGEPS